MPDGSYGIQLFNNYGHNVATVNDVNFTLRASGQIHNSQFAPPFATSAASMCAIDLSGFNCPIVFFRPMSADQRIACVAGDERDWTPEGWPVKMMNKIMKWNNKDIGTIQYYVFDRWIPPERSSYGLQLFNEAGSIIFDSGWHFMNIQKVLWLDPGYPSHSASDPEGANWAVVGSAGVGNYAMAMPVPRGWVVNNWTGQGAYHLYECYHFSDIDNKITISLVPRGEYLWTPPSDGWANPRSRSQVMVVKVDGMPTNYNERPILSFTA